MEQLNREEIIRALECCESHEGDNCPHCSYHYTIAGYNHHCREDMVSDALALIKELTEEVENCRNELGGVRVALSEANKNKKKLTEERDAFRVCAYNLQDYVNGIFEKRSQGYESSVAKAAAEMEMWRRISYSEKKLKEENEKLHESCTELTQCCTKLETLYKIECKRVDTVKADTVRKMQERLKAIKPLSITTEYGYDFEGVELKYIDQIAKEMLEG